MTHDDGRGRAMAAEMAEQPAVLRALQGRHEEVAASLAPLRARTLASLVIIARGSSDHAAIYGRYLLELATRRPVSLAAPSLSTRYRAQTDYSGYLAVAVSQSGHTPEIVDVLHTVRGAGAAGIAVINDPGSPLAEVADAVIPLGAGDERAVPATKTFTAQLAAFALLAEALGPVPWSANAWQALWRRCSPIAPRCFPPWSRCARATVPSTSAAGSSSAPRSRARSR